MSKKVPKTSNMKTYSTSQVPSSLAHLISSPRLSRLFLPSLPPYHSSPSPPSPSQFNPRLHLPTYPPSQTQPSPSIPRLHLSIHPCPPSLAYTYPTLPTDLGKTYPFPFPPKRSHLKRTETRNGWNFAICNKYLHTLLLVYLIGRLYDRVWGWGERERD